MLALLLSLIALGCAVASVTLAINRMREERHHNMVRSALDLADAQAVLRGIELTVRENRVLGDSAGIMADLVLDKIDAYHNHKLRVELGVTAPKQGDGRNGRS